MSTPPANDSRRRTVKKLIADLRRPTWKFWLSPARAASELRQLGDLAQEAVPDLIQHICSAAKKSEDPKVLDKTVVHGPFADAIVSIGAPAVDLLTREFASAHEGVKYAIVEITARFGEVAVPKLITILRTGTNREKADAAWAVASIGAAACDAVPAINATLGEALKPDAVTYLPDKEGTVRKIEIRAEHTEADIAFLQSLHSHREPKPSQLRDHHLILACLAALGAIGPAATGTRQTVEYALKVGKDDTVIKSAAEYTLRNLRGSEAIRLLCEKSEPDYTGITNLACALRNVGLAGAREVRAFIAASRNEAARYDAIKRLGHRNEVPCVLNQSEMGILGRSG